MPRKREYDRMRSEDAEAIRKQAIDAVRRYDPCLWYMYYGCASAAREAWSSKQRFVGVEGMQRSGKTSTGIASICAYARGIHPAKPWFGPVRCLISIATRAQSATEWGPRLVGTYNGIYGEGSGCRLYNRDDPSMRERPFIPPEEIKSVTAVPCPAGRSVSHITLTNGSEMWIILGDDPNSWKAAESTSFDAILIDEAIGDATMAGTLYTRLGDAIQLDLDGVRPGAGWMMRTFTEFVANMEISQFRRKCENPAEKDFALYRLKVDDNPACRTSARKVLAHTMSKKEAQKRVFGTRNASEDTRIYGAQYSSARHLLAEPYEWGNADNVFLCIDPGWTNPLGVTVAAMGPENPERLIFTAYFSSTVTLLKEVLPLVREYLGGRSVAYVAYDPAANQTQKNTGHPLIDDYITWFDECNIEVTGDFLAGHNRHDPTIQQVQDWLDPTPWDKTSPPRVVFDPYGPGMELAIEELENYHRDPKTGQVYKKDDTFPDCLRYTITIDPVYERPANLHKGKPKSALAAYRQGKRDMPAAQREYYAKLEAYDDEDDHESHDMYGGIFSKAM